MVKKFNKDKKTSASAVHPSKIIDEGDEKTAPIEGLEGYEERVKEFERQKEQPQNESSTDGFGQVKDYQRKNVGIKQYTEVTSSDWVDFDKEPNEFKRPSLQEVTEKFIAAKSSPSSKENLEDIGQQVVVAMQKEGLNEIKRFQESNGNVNDSDYAKGILNIHKDYQGMIDEFKDENNLVTESKVKDDKDLTWSDKINKDKGGRSDDGFFLT